MPTKILMAEDDKPLAHALQLKLQNEGYEVVCAYDGEEALGYMAKEKFDLVILDVIMPKKDGFAVLEEMQKQNIKIPTIVSSNLSQPEDVARAKKSGAIDYYVKSNISLAEFAKQVKTTLEKLAQDPQGNVGE